MHLVPDLDSKIRQPVVAIDGPAGAGKSTVARFLAQELGYTLVDTGALYRTLALHAIEQGLSLSDGLALAGLCSKLKFQFGSLSRSSLPGVAPQLHIYCNGIDVSSLIRTPELGMAASNVSKIPEVRAALLEVQRDFGKMGGIVMEGRDIGTVIFPGAELKFFLTASVESRARRRFEEVTQAGSTASYEQVLRETKLRDEQDTQRAIAPLRQASDAILVDSTQRSLEEVLIEMVTHVRHYLSKSKS